MTERLVLALFIFIRGIKMAIGTTQVASHGLSNPPEAPTQSSCDDKTANAKKQSIRTEQSLLSLTQPVQVVQEIDVTSNTIDSILLSGMSSAQKKEAGEIFKQLQSLFDGNPTGVGVEEQADELLNRVDSIMESVFNKLSQNKQDSIALLSMCENQVESNLEQQLIEYVK